MNEFKNILDTIKRPFKWEIKNGCSDQTVVDGLENYVSVWSDKARALSLGLAETKIISELHELFAKYAQLSPIERINRLQDATKLIDSYSAEELPLSSDQKTADSTASQKELALTTAPANAVHDSSIARKQTEPSPAMDDVSADVLSTSPEPASTVEVPDDIDQLKLFATPIQYTSGIGPRRATVLHEVNVDTLGDLLEYYPRDYLDRRNFKQIYQVGRTNEYETIQGKVVNHVEFLPQRRGAPKVCKIIVYDETEVAAIVGFGKRGNTLKHFMPIDAQVVVSGKFSRKYKEIQTTTFEYEILSEEDIDLIHTGRIVPKYPLTSKLTQRNIRNWIKTALDEYGESIPEILPLEIRQRLQLIDRRTAIFNIHFPDSMEHQSTARKRLAFDELFFLELGLSLRKQRFQLEEQGIAFNTEGELLNRFISQLPFQLTNAQKRVFSEIKSDMESSRPMNRLLQGDVGSGKTVVAALALAIAIDSGYQGALMAPTEILAEQHYHTLNELLASLNLNIVQLKGDMLKKEKDEVYAAISDGSAHIAVGTHALIQKGVEFHNLGFAIVDEQHRFGVMQRATLRHKSVMPDALVMTATPIPRTLALTVYGDLDVSTIDEMPPGRRKVHTRWVPEGKRQQMYQFIEEHVQQGRQAFLVYPLVEESEKLEDLKSATEMAEHFQNDIFPHLKVGLIHGRMRSNEKQDIMQSFKNGDIQMLAT